MKSKHVFKKLCLKSLLLTVLFIPFNVYTQIEAPKIDGKPVNVGVKFLVNEILDINTVEETFDIDGYLTLVWNDSSLVQIFPDEDHIIYDNEVIASFLGKTIWHPNIEIMNAVGGREIIKQRMVINGDQIIYVERFQAKMQSHMDFTDFPFDQQTCNLVIESFGFNAGDFVFVPIHTDRTEVEHIENDAWDFSNMKSNTYLFTYENSIAKKGKEAVKFSRYEFSIHAKRKAGYFIWQFFLPLIILIVATWFIPAQWERGNAQDLIFTMLLTSVMFSFYSSAFLPQLSYNTFLETVVIVTNGVVFLTLLLVLTRKEKDGRQPFYHKVWFVPVITILAFTITIIAFFLF